MKHNIKKLVKIISLLFALLLYSCAIAATYKETQNAANAEVTKNYKLTIKDPTYPKYHLRAPSGWINDPCGLFYFNSSFHVFCQSNPWGVQWGNMTWSHVVSDPDQKFNYKWFYPESKNKIYDVSAIIPSLNINAPDGDGIFTGCVEILPFKEKDSFGKIITTYYPTALYSGVWGTDESEQEVICMARALNVNKVNDKGELIDPYLTEWTKYSSTSKNEPNSHPDIILKQPKELNLISFRDPHVVCFPNDPNYYMTVSGGVIDKNNKPKGVILLFKNDGKDLTKNWIRVNTGSNFFFSVDTDIKDTITGGGDIECGVVYRLTDHIGTTNNTPYIMIFGQDASPNIPYGKSIFYVLGNIEKTDNEINFTPLKEYIDSQGNIKKAHLDLNPDFVFYATNTIHIDNEQRRYLIGWLNIGSQANNGKSYPWAGALSSPRFLFVYKENNKWKLGQEPVLVNALRMKTLFQGNIKFNDNKTVAPKAAKGRFVNIDTVFKGKQLDKSVFGIKVACCNDKCTDIKIANGKLTVGNSMKIDLNIPENASKYGINIYLDGSTMEIFLSKFRGDVPITYRTYSSSLPNNGKVENNAVKFYGDKGLEAKINIYSMDSCWEK
jgi:sucrose-6-phosphate hydrolase SacC (GH32 family)